jgi:protein TonB
VFEDSLFATNVRRSPQRGLAAVLSFGVQAVCLSALVLIPLFYTDALPLNALKSFVVEVPAPPGPPAQPPPTNNHPRPQHESNFQGATLLPPNRIPGHAADIHESAAPPPPGPYIPDSTGGTGRGSPLINSLLASNMRPAPPPPANIQPKSIRLSGGVTEGLLIQRITPSYPTIARQGRIQGSVVLQAIISRNGTIENLQLVSGHPMLVKAAMDAVKQWRYRPYLLNNEPVEVETQITVNFTLGG